MNYIIAIDQSTSSTKALLFDEQCRVVARTNVDHKQYYPQTGWVEHDAEEIYNNMVEAIRQLVVSSHLSPLTIPEQSSPTRSLSHLSPLKLRYAWKDDPKADVRSLTGLPMSSFELNINK